MKRRAQAHPIRRAPRYTLRQLAETIGGLIFLVAFVGFFLWLLTTGAPR